MNISVCHLTHCFAVFLVFFYVCSIHHVTYSNVSIVLKSKLNATETPKAASLTSIHLITYSVLAKVPEICFVFCFAELYYFLVKSSPDVQSRFIFSVEKYRKDPLSFPVIFVGISMNTFFNANLDVRQWMKHVTTQSRVLLTEALFLIHPYFVTCL